MGSSGCTKKPRMLSPFLLPLGERLRGPESWPAANDDALARQGIASVWGSAEAAFASRAHPLRVLQPIRRYSRAQERSSVLLGLGRLLPAPSTLQPELSHLPSLSTSSTPRGVAPPLSPSPPPQPSERVHSFPFTLLLSSRSRARSPQSGLGLSGLVGRLRALSPCGPPPDPSTAASLLRPGRGVARSDSAPPHRGLAHSRPGLSPAQAAERPAASPSLPGRRELPGRSRSRALRGERAPGPRAPGSGFSRLLSVR